MVEPDVLSLRGDGQAEAVPGGSAEALPKVVAVLNGRPDRLWAGFGHFVSAVACWDAAGLAP